MEDNNTTTQATDNGATEQATTAPVTSTPPQAATVDVDAITRAASEKAEEAASRKMEAVFKSMLAQQGLDSETIAKMTDEWKSKQVTPELQMQEKDAAIAAAKAENETLQRQIAAIGKGVPADKAAKYIKLAESYMDASTGFDAALDAAIADFPFQKQERPPAYAAGTGTNTMLGADDEFAKRIAKYAK